MYLDGPNFSKLSALFILLPGIFFAFAELEVYTVRSLLIDSLATCQTLCVAKSATEATPDIYTLRNAKAIDGAPQP